MNSSVLKRKLIPTLTWIMTSCFLPGIAMSQEQWYIDNKDVYVTQLHIHGWSHHNGSPTPGSIQFHNWQAQEENVDVLWWSEHHNMFKQKSYWLKFDGGAINPNGSHIENISSGSGTHSRWECIQRDQPSTLSLNDDTLTAGIGSATSSVSFKEFSYSPRSSKGLIKDINVIKPMAADPVLAFSVRPHFQNSMDGRLRITVRMSYQFKGAIVQDILIYNFIEGTNSPTTSTNGKDTVWVVHPLQDDIWQTVTLDLNTDISNLQNGNDNTISDIEFSFISRKGSYFEGSLCGIELRPEDNDAASLVNKERSVLSSNTTLYNINNILGVEYSGQDHLNGFFPSSVSDTNIFKATTGGLTLDWVQKVHDEGGIVSYNHVFGTGWNLQDPQTQDLREDTIVSFLLNSNCLDADILEVGYLKRGGADLEHHLRVWDRLNAHGNFIFGNGVSDSHGGIWMGNDKIFHTYLWSETSGDQDILESLSKGKMFFGILERFHGVFYYSIDNLEMGDRGFINRKDPELRVMIDPLPAGHEIRFTQALIKENEPIKYLYYEFPIVYPGSVPQINVSEPSFIRLSVFDQSGDPVAFGQPIVILGTSNDIDPDNYIKNAELTSTIFPNPVSTIMNLQISIPEKGRYRISIINAASQEVKLIDSKLFYSAVTGYRVNVSDLPTGTYFVRIEGADRSVNSRFVKLRD